ncbi:MAG: coenzyme F420-0:L-glutamate ligase, partial [Nitrosopumilus sp.]
EKDLFGRRMVITRVAIAADLAAVAHLLMGEGSQRIPIAIIKNAPIKLSLKKIPMNIRPSECLFLRVFDPNPILHSN